MRCSNCGKDVSGGNFTITRGFVCYTCSAGLGVALCPDCGNRYPGYDLVRFEGRQYCRSDYGRRFRKAEKEAELAKERAKPKNLIKKKTGVRKRITERRISARDLGLLGKYDAFKKKYGPKPRAKPKKRLSADKVKLEIHEILRQELNKSLSLGRKKERGGFLALLTKLRDKTRGKRSK